MANRKRNIQMKFYVTEDEKRLIDEKMSQLPTRRYGAYLRKMAIDGYIIYTDTADIKAFTKELSAIGRNINQIAKRINAGGPAYQADMDEIRERLDEIPSSCALPFSKQGALQRASFRHIKGVSYDLKIGLIDVDSHNFPNLCLMKLSAYHKAKGHTVEWWNTKERYDLVYKSRVFTDTYSKDTITVTNAEQVIFGGTGYDTKNRLPPEVEHSYPDYSIYPQFFGIAYGFLSRGCPRNCGFCIVSGKEGRKSVKVADLSEFWKWQPEIKIMDANLLACPDHENLIEQLIRSRAWVDFSQGLDIRLVNRDNVSLLNRVRIKAVHFAWDNPDEDLTGYFQRFLDLTAIKSSRQRRVYVLTNYGSTHEQDLYRVNTLRAMGFDPYVMIYERPTAPPVTRHLQRWVNNKRLFYAVPRFEDYIPGRKEV